MITVINVCMLSGGCQWDPKCELSDEQTALVVEKVRQLKNTGENTYRGHFCGLGPENFQVYFATNGATQDNVKWALDFNVTEPQESLKDLPDNLFSLDCTPGYVGVHRYHDGKWWDKEEFTDTVGLHDLLKEYAVQAFKNSEAYHAEQHAKYKEEHPEYADLADYGIYPVDLKNEKVPGTTE